MKALILPLLLCACATPAIEVRHYENMGNLKEVQLYADANDLSHDCVTRSGGVNDHGAPMAASNGCTDVKNGVVRVADSPAIRTFLHELCHVDGRISRAQCEKLFPGGN